MASLIGVVQQEMERLRKEIAKQTSELENLTRELKSHEKIAAMLGSNSTQRKSARKTQKTAAKSNGRTNWGELLDNLPRFFTATEVRQAAGETSNQADVHQALLRWRKAGKVATRQRGKYRKTQASGS